VVRGTEKVGNLLDGALPSVVELLGERDLLTVERWSTTALASASPGGGEPIACVGDDQLTLKLC